MLRLSSRLTGLVFFFLFLIASQTIILSAQGQSASDGIEQKIKVQIVASHLTIPWSIAFAEDGRIFFTERIGTVRVIDKNGILLADPASVINVARAGEGGLLGIALDPDFGKNHHVYIYYTYSDFLSLFNRVSRFTESNNKISNEQILLDQIPASFVHDGGRIKFGPDNKLYIATGVASDPDSAQNIESLSGKILRINADGTIPGDNPFQGSPVYSYGNRNPQGLAWDPVSGKLVETEHGPSGEMNLHGHDEINVIEAGKNYGWPRVIGIANNSNYVDPVVQTGDTTWAPSGATFYTDNKIPEWEGKLLVATLRGSQLEAVQFDSNITKATSIDSFFQGTYGRLRDIEQAPNGSLYLLTSNQDGRGTPGPDDDKILRIDSESSAAVPEFDAWYPLLAMAFVFVVAFKLRLREGFQRWLNRRFMPSKQYSHGGHNRYPVLEPDVMKSTAQNGIS